MAVARPLGFEIDFVRKPISGSAAWFFVIILKIIFKPIFEIEIHGKKILDTKKKFPIFIKAIMAAHRPYRKRRQYLTPPAWE